MAGGGAAGRSLAPTGGGAEAERRGFGAQFPEHDPDDARQEEVDECQQAELEDAENDVGHGSGALEPDLGAADSDDVTIGQGVLPHLGAVDAGSVGGAEVGDPESGSGPGDLGVVA